MEKIDFAYLNVLSEDDEDFKNEFIEIFKENYILLVKKMKNELANGDLNNLSKSAHKLKPSLKMIELPCSGILEDIQYHPEKATKDSIDMINMQCEDALKQLKKWVA